MKKLFTLVAMALLAVGANAQKLVAEKDWSGVADLPGFVQFADDAQGSAEMVADGISITVNADAGTLWQPQLSVLEGFDLAMDGNYKVVVVAKFPTNGQLQINMGDWSNNFQYDFPVEATGDFQEVECEFPEYGADVTGGHVLFQCGNFLGNTIFKSVKVYDMDAEGGDEPGGDEPGGDEPAAGGAIVAEKDWTGVADLPGFVQFADDAQGSAEMVADGIAITVNADAGTLWQPQLSVLEGFDLAMDGNYKVVVVAKFPTNGQLQINMGDWSNNFQYDFPVEATGDFQEVECEFPEYGADVTNGHVLFQCGNFLGTTIFKSVKVINLDAEGGDEPGGDEPGGDEPGGDEPGGEPAGPSVIAEKDWTGVADLPGFVQFADDAQGSAEMVADGISITVNADAGTLWQPQLSVLEGFDLAMDGNYKVVVVAKFPTNGQLQINMGDWSNNFQYDFPVEATGDFQEVECEFPEYGADVTNGHVLFQCGNFLGTTIFKSVKVIDMDATAIQSVKKAEKFDGAIYNLAGQKVNASYKGVVIKNGKKYLQK